MIWMILSFLFVYCFVVGLYYLVQNSNSEINDEIVPNNSKIQNAMPLAEAGKLYSDMINIPIIDDVTDINDVEIPEKSEQRDTYKCENCRRSLPEDSKFCIYCGFKLH